jgi:hypothetical protein
MATLVSSKTVAEKFATLNPWQRREYNPIDFRHQSCRFCKRSIGTVPGLRKYGVRHYACDECRDRIIKEASA